MRRSDVEHAFIVQSSPLPSEWPTLSGAHISDVVSRSLHQVIEGIDQALATFDGGGWTVVSHSTLIANGSLIVNFLIRRPHAG